MNKKEELIQILIDTAEAIRILNENMSRTMEILNQSESFLSKILSDVITPESE